MEFVQSIVTFT